MPSTLTVSLRNEAHAANIWFFAQYITPAGSSPPLNIVAINETVVKIHLSWDAPSNPRGIIVAYRVSPTTQCILYKVKVHYFFIMLA